MEEEVSGTSEIFFFLFCKKNLSRVYPTTSFRHNHMQRKVTQTKKELKKNSGRSLKSFFILGRSSFIGAPSNGPAISSCESEDQSQSTGPKEPIGCPPPPVRLSDTSDSASSWALLTRCTFHGLPPVSLRGRLLEGNIGDCHLNATPSK